MIQNLSQKLKALRIKYGYSQKLVADKIGVSPSVVSGYETGERTPSTEVLLALSYLYNTSTDYLLGRSAELPKSVISADGLTDRQIAALNELADAIRARKG